eukprot:gene724-132_t
MSSGSGGDPAMKVDKEKLKEYPYNLLYSQHMMSMAQAQAHQWEVYSFMLQQQMAMRNIEACLAGGVVPQVQPVQQTPMMQFPGADGGAIFIAQPSPSPAPAVSPEVKASVEQHAAEHVAAETPVAPSIQITPDADAAAAANGEAGAAPEAAAGEGGAAAAAANGENGENAENGGLWRRFRIGPIVKVALIMLLLEVKPVWFFVYFFAVFLYLGGIFDPIVDWFKRHAEQPQLEQQLVGLREREEEAANALPENTVESAEVTPENTAEEDELGEDGLPKEKSTGSSEKPADGAERNSDGATAGGSSAGDAEGLKSRRSSTASDGATLKPKAGEPGAEDAAEEQAPPVPYIIRFCYQLFVMFFMTLLPMWNPDPRYLH